jgi:hypothetical protein
MAVVNPPGFLQNAGATHTAEQMRNWFGVGLGVSNAANSLVAAGGVNYVRGFGLVVTQTGSPSMAVIVRSGEAFIPGTEGSKQGVYAVLNDADVTLSITAAHATLNRIDLVCFKVEDTAYSGAANTSSLVVVTGTPAGSPTAPTAPNNSITLASVSVVAADTSITNGEITDLRLYVAGAGGVIPIRNSGARPAAGTEAPGTWHWHIQGGKFEFNNGSAIVDGMPLYKARNTLGGSAATVSFTGIPSNLRELTLKWTARSTDAATNVLVQLRVNNDSGANYFDEFLFYTATTAPVSNFENGTGAWRIGRATGAGAPANVFGVGTLELVGWDSPHANHLGAVWRSFAGATAAAPMIEDGAGTFATAGPYNRLDIICNTGSFIAGSDFSLVGVYA